MPSSRSSKSPPLAADLERSSARARDAASSDVSRSWTPLKPSAISWRNWWSGEPSRVGSSSWATLRPVAVEVLAEQAADAADRGVPPRLVEQLVHELLERAAVAEELLERPRQPAVAVGEVGAQDVLDGARGLLVDGRRLGDELLELAPDDVDVDRGRRVLEGQQADAQGTLDDGRALAGLALGERRGEDRVREDEALDDDPVAVDAHRDAVCRAAAAAAIGVGRGRIWASMARILGDPP